MGAFTVYKLPHGTYYTQRECFCHRAITGFRWTGYGSGERPTWFSLGEAENRFFRDNCNVLSLLGLQNSI